MRKLQLGGALALGMVIVTMGGASAQALSEDVKQDLYGAVNRVTRIKDEIQQCGAACQSATFPGVSNYLERLLNDAHKEMTDAEAEQYIAALNDAEVAAPLLSGLARQKSEKAQSAAQGTVSTPVRKTEITSVMTEMELELPETGNQTEMPEPVEVKTTVKKPAEAAKAVNEKKAENVKTVQVAKAEDEKAPVTKTEKASSAENLETKTAEDVEVPATGRYQDEQKISAGMLVVAGVAVVIATIGATILIIRMKKDA